VTNIYATPERPALAVRPTLCVYASGVFGRSRLITTSTCGMSIPLQKQRNWL